MGSMGIIRKLVKEIVKEELNRRENPAKVAESRSCDNCGNEPCGSGACITKRCDQINLGKDYYANWKPKQKKEPEKSCDNCGNGPFRGESCVHAWIKRTCDPFNKESRRYFANWTPKDEPKKLVPITKENYREATIELWELMAKKDIEREGSTKSFKNKLLQGLGYQPARNGCPCCELYYAGGCEECTIHHCCGLGYLEWIDNLDATGISSAELAGKFLSNIRPKLVPHKWKAGDCFRSKHGKRMIMRSFLGDKYDTCNNEAVLQIGKPWDDLKELMSDVYDNATPISREEFWK